MKQGSITVATTTIPPPGRSEHEYRYRFGPKRKNIVPLDESQCITGSPLDLLSSAASAVIDDETASLASSSSHNIRTRSMSPPLPPKFQDLPKVKERSRLPPVAFAIPPSPPTAYAVPSSLRGQLTFAAAPNSHLSSAAVPPQSQMRAVFPYSSRENSFPMSQSMKSTLSHPPTATIPTTIPYECTSTNIWSRPQKTPAFVPKAAKRQNTKYMMKYRYVSMKRSEAIKYMEALSKGYEIYHPGNYGVQKPIPSRTIRPHQVLNTTISYNYHLPVATVMVSPN